MQSSHGLTQHWTLDERWEGIKRPYSSDDVNRLRGTVSIEHTLAKLGAERLWRLLHDEPFIAALDALTGNQAVQQVRAGLLAIYLSGWQVAADANDAGQMYPDQGLYPADSVPNVARKINNALIRADQIHHAKGKNGIHWFAPIVADGEAGFGSNLNTFELMKAMIEAGAASVHFEDQSTSAKRSGHKGGKVLIPTSEFIQKLVAARFASDIMGVPTLLIARTDAAGSACLSNDIDERDHPFLSGERTSEGYYVMHGGINAAVARGLAYAPYADLLWCETSEPNLENARLFANAIHEEFPGKLLAYNCSPSSHWREKLDAGAIARFQRDLGSMGYKFQFVALSGFHTLNHSMYELARRYREWGMTAYADFQETEFKSEEAGYKAARHQEFVGTAYYDEIAHVVSTPSRPALHLNDTPEEALFHHDVKAHDHVRSTTRPPLKKIPAAGG